MDPAAPASAPPVLSAPGLRTREHTISVPLRHDDPGGESIEVFAREVADPDPDAAERPFLVYFQGGPGFEADRPCSLPRGPGWLDRALRDYRVLLLDQRGTGRSTPLGRLDGRQPAAQAEYLTHFRADSIVRDAELMREHLGVERWSVLGQSFGGFCVTAYLSRAPSSLREAFLTGGLPPLRRPIDDVYRCTYRRVRDRFDRYLERYPADRERLARLRERLESDDPLRLPGGERLSWRRFRQVGIDLGMADGAARIHHLLERPFDSPAFLHDVAGYLAFERNPIYAILHESCYADGGPTNWAAQRLLPDSFDADNVLTGEHVYPWMFEEYPGLAPLAQAAERLADHSWPPLYDPEVLAANEVPAAAAIYVQDMYVEREFSEQTAARIRGLRPWITNEYEHDGLRSDGDRVLGRLIDLARGRA
jgi:pimeloyl-ACP methyl ester carboxylesterase